MKEEELNCESCGKPANAFISFSGWLCKGCFDEKLRAD